MLWAHPIEFVKRGFTVLYNTKLTTHINHKFTGSALHTVPIFTTCPGEMYVPGRNNSVATFSLSVI